MRLYAELEPLLDRDAIVIGDGGDFVSFAGRLVDSFEPGCWLDPARTGASARARLRARGQARPPERQVVLLQGDGAFGFRGWSGTRSASRRCGRRGDGQQRHLGAREAPDGVDLRILGRGRLQPETRYDQVVETLGGHGELVRARESCARRFERALASGRPSLINVLTDPSVAYPRRSNLA